MSTATTTEPITGQHTTSRNTTQPTSTPTNQVERNAANRLRQMVARDFEQIQASVAELLVDRPRRNILRRGNVGGAV